jgi:hypothetical protein
MSSNVGTTALGVVAVHPSAVVDESWRLSRSGRLREADALSKDLAGNRASSRRLSPPAILTV